MFSINDFNGRIKLFLLIFSAGFLVKYNYLILNIFYTPTIIGVISKNFFIVLLLLYILPILINKRKYNLLVLFSSLFTLFFIANYWYFNYFGSYLSLHAVGQAGNLFPFLEIVFKQILKPIDLIFFIDLILLIVFYPKQNRTLTINFFKNRAGIVKLIIILLLLSQIFLTNHILGGYNPEELYQLNSGAFVNVYGIIPLYLYEGYHKFLEANNNGNSPEDIDTPAFLRETNFKKTSSAKTPKTKNLNLIVIQVESLDYNIIGHKYKDKEVTPFLNQLKEESIFAENFFAQHINGTLDADFSFLTSLYPLNKHYAFNNDDMSRYNSLPRVLKEKGYKTKAFHGNTKSFFHRNKGFPDIGFEDFWGLNDYDCSRIKAGRGPGINDYDFFKQTFAEMKTLEQPFFSFIITLTSHGPFNYYPEKYKNETFEQINNELVKDYFQSMHFVDKSLEMFYEKLKKGGLLKNSVLVIYGDHDSAIKEQEYSARNIFNITENISNLPEQVPLYIQYPGVHPTKTKKNGSTPDLAPTILKTLGFSKKPEGFAGVSLLDEKEHPKIFLNERPLVLFKNQLFEYYNNKFNWKGYLKEQEEDKQVLTEDDRKQVLELINYFKEIY